jgi:hypothetical protein
VTIGFQNSIIEIEDENNKLNEDTKQKETN